MSLLFAAALIATAPQSSADWYGPATVLATIPFTGNPYDPAENDVQVEFTDQDGPKEKRLAYYVGGGHFASTLVAHKPGTYQVRFFLNGKLAAKAPRPVVVQTPLKHGYLGIQGKRFQWSDGTPYFPIGYDFGWRGGPDPTVAAGIQRMGRAGCNWSRIWTSHWDMKNPFWPSDAAHPLPTRQLREEPLRIWDEITNAAEKSGVDFQFVLFHHGPYSTTTDSNWGEHPWNTKNGGFLADPTDFFSDPEAKRRTKIWLRYAVARYAHSPSIMAWELFNEVQWVDAIKKNPDRVNDVAKWHREMAKYIRSLDPYHHLVTSSSNESLDHGIFNDMDYLQPHTYPANVLGAIGGYRFKKKIGFFGEFGPPGGGDHAKQVRDGIYGGTLAGHAGAGQYWFWDQVQSRGLLPSFSAARKVIDESGLLLHTDGKPLNVWCETPSRMDAVLSAGLGWAKSSTSELELPRVSISDLGGWSQYFQSLDGGQKAWAKPLTLRFDASSAGQLKLNVTMVSPKGGALKVWINDREMLDQKFTPLVENTRAPSRPPVILDYPAGKVTVRIENHGEDWVCLDSITVPGQASTAYAHGLGEKEWALIRVFGSDTSRVRISGSGLANGRYSAVVFDTTNGKTKGRTLEVSGGAFETTDLPADCVLAISK